MLRIRRTWFSLHGCMSRRKFVLAELALAALLLLLGPLAVLAFAAAAGAIGLHEGTPLFERTATLAALAAGAPLLWAAAAPMVKRCRDAGLPPAALLGAVFLMPSLDRMLLVPAFAARLPGPLDFMTPIAGALIASAWVLMVVMPNRYVVRDAPLRAAEKAARRAARAAAAGPRPPAGPWGARR
ncbi:MAG: hypothetical protein K1X35_05065 [Caulobacteraceae bacterium]|nr:hypothetical protein [Caulobacteraceae bacterium]